MSSYPELALPLSATLSVRDIRDVQSAAGRVEELGYQGIWVGEGRLRRDAVTQLTLAAAATRRCYLSSGIVPARTRNVALLAITWKTLYQLAPGRVRLGLGAWWEPIASRVGLHTASPLTALREIVAVLRTMFAGDEASYRGEYVRVDHIRFDGAEDEDGAEYPIPIYLAAVGPRMLELASNIADGILLDFFLPSDYLRSAMPFSCSESVSEDQRCSPDLPQLLACIVDDLDPGSAIEEMRVIVARYLIQQDHIALHSGADPEFIKKLRSQLSWPATTSQLREAARDVPLNLVRSIAAVGTTRDVVEAAERRLAAGATEIVLSPFGDRNISTLESIAKYTG
jgi:5,10-methylenetetrahydromethanopterin reductase